MRPTSKAVIELLSRTDGKRGRFFVVKGTKAKQVGTALFKLHVTTHDVGYVDSCKQILYEGIRDQRFNLSR